MKHRTVMHQTHAHMISCRLCAVGVFNMFKFFCFVFFFFFFFFFFSLRPVILLCVVKAKEKKEEKQTNGESVKNGGTFVDDKFWLHMIFVTFEIMGCLVYKRILAKCRNHFR